MEFEEWLSAYEEHLFNMRGVVRRSTWREDLAAAWQAATERAAKIIMHLDMHYPDKLKIAAKIRGK